MNSTTRKAFPLLYSNLLLFTLAFWSVFYGLSDEFITSSRYGTLPKGLTPSLIYCAIGLAYGIFKDWQIANAKKREGANNILLQSKKGGFLIQLAAIVTAILAPLATLSLIGVVDNHTTFLMLRCLHPFLLGMAALYVVRNARWITGSILLNQRAKLKKQLYLQSAFMLINFGVIFVLSWIPYSNIFKSPMFPIIVCFIAATAFGNFVGRSLALLLLWRQRRS